MDISSFLQEVIVPKGILGILYTNGQNIQFKCFNTQKICYSNTTVYYRIHEHSECIPVDCGVTNLIHDHRSCVDFTLEVEANVARCVHSSVNKPGVKRNSEL